MTASGKLQLSATNCEMMMQECGFTMFIDTKGVVHSYWYGSLSSWLLSD